MSPTFQTSPGNFGRILLVAATLGCASTITVRAADDRPIAKPVQKDVVVRGTQEGIRRGPRKVLC